MTPTMIALKTPSLVLSSSFLRRFLALPLLLLALGCKRAPEPAAAPPAATAPDPAAALLAGVVDPWQWPRAAGATDRDRAIEDIGPYEPAAPGQPPVNTNADYCTR